MTKLSRFDKARARVLLDDIKIISTDKDGKIKTAFVAGSKTRIYQVIIRREGNQISGECLLETGNGQEICKGSYKTACYHILSVALKSAMVNGFEASLCKRFEDARLMKRFGGEIYQIVSKHAVNNPVFLVANKKAEKNNKTNYGAVA
jgi:hypothetical protein